MQANQEAKITVGLTLFLIKNNKLLLAKRRNVVGNGEYSLIGGHLEHGEGFMECLKREFIEEVGNKLKFTEPKLLCVTNSLKYKPIHHVALTFSADWTGGELINMEPNKNEDLAWYELGKLPNPLFPLVNFALTTFNGGPNVHNM